MEREREEGGIATRRCIEIQPAEWTVLIRIGVANEQYRCVALHFIQRKLGRVPALPS